MPMLRLAITGHRPQKLGGFNPNNPILQRIADHLTRTLTALKSRGLDVLGLTGMALGVDQAFAEACLTTQTPFVAYIPFPGQASRWPKQSQTRYEELLRLAMDRLIVCHTAKTDAEVREALMARNSRLVTDAHAAIAVWDGSAGGTADAVRKLRTRQHPLIILHPDHPYPTADVARWIDHLAHHHAGQLIAT